MIFQVKEIDHLFGAMCFSSRGSFCFPIVMKVKLVVAEKYLLRHMLVSKEQHSSFLMPVSQQFRNLE